MFVSDLSNSEIIDDDNFAPLVPAEAEPEAGGYGYIARDYEKFPYGSMFDPFEALNLPLIDRSEYDARIEEMEKTKSRLSDMYLARGWQKPNQNGTNFCWMYACTSAMKLDRAKQNLPWKAYSAESAAAPINGFRNSGGWSTNGAKWAATKGVCTEETWPPHSYASRHYTDANKAVALENLITSWTELTPRSFKVLMTMLFHRMPCPIGLNWWRHAICAADPVKLGNNAYGVRILNSHNDGFAKVLTESRATPDDVLCLYNVMSN